MKLHVLGANLCRAHTASRCLAAAVRLVLGEAPEPVSVITTRRSSFDVISAEPAKHVALDTVTGLVVGHVAELKCHPASAR